MITAQTTVKTRYGDSSARTKDPLSEVHCVTHTTLYRCTYMRLSSVCFSGVLLVHTMRYNNVLSS
jgi:hypothetical protein